MNPQAGWEGTLLDGSPVRPASLQAAWRVAGASLCQPGRGEAGVLVPSASREVRTRPLPGAAIGSATHLPGRRTRLRRAW